MTHIVLYEQTQLTKKEKKSREKEIKAAEKEAKQDKAMTMEGLSQK